MYTSTPTLLTTLLLLSTTALALPQPAPQRNTPSYSAAAGYGPAPSTVTVTSYTTVFPPAATVAATTSAYNNWNVSVIILPITPSPSSSSPSSSSFPPELEGTLTFTTTATSTVVVTRVVTASGAATVVATSTSASTSASASSTPTPSLSAMAGVYICSDINWSGTCTHSFIPTGAAPSSCTVLNGTASSIGPDVGFRCDFYTNSFCDSLYTDGRDVIALSYPGTADMRSTVKGDLNDRVLSYQCFVEGVGEDGDEE